MTTMRRLLRADGTTMDLDGPRTMPELMRLIGAKTIDTVNLHHLGRPLHVMLVDDNGYESELVSTGPSTAVLKPIRAKKPVNVEATRMYHANCRPGTTHQIVGDVAIVPDEDFA
jgi:hypothetical protein